jgi:uncharacterized protein YkwD
MRRAFQASLATAVVLAAFAAPAHADCPGADLVPSAGAATGAYSTVLLCLLNQERDKRGLGPLASRPKLVQAATGHAQSMRSQGFFSHDSPNGDSFIDRVRATGYTNGATYWALGENIGWGSGGFGTPRALESSWMNSPPHRANILSRRFNQAGVGVAWGSPFGPDAHAAVVTTDFGIVKH